MSVITLQEIRALRAFGGTQEMHGRNVGRIGFSGREAAQLWISEALAVRGDAFVSSLWSGAPAELVVGHERSTRCASSSRQRPQLIRH